MLILVYDSFCLYESDALQGSNEFISTGLFLSLWGLLIIYTLAASESCVGHHSGISSFFWFGLKLFSSFFFFNSVGFPLRERLSASFASLFRGLSVSINFLRLVSPCASFKKQQQQQPKCRSSPRLHSKNVSTSRRFSRNRYRPSHALVYSLIYSS